MGNPRGFLDFQRVELIKLEPEERIKNYREFSELPSKKEQERQGGRCMNCGVPFCQVGKIEQKKEIGCPLKNLIPEWNDLIYKGLWEEAYRRLSLTNPFPEFTGRVCPAPCEDSCVCAINGKSVTIKNNELAIIENAYKENLIKPIKPLKKKNKKVAIIGSGPAGLSCAYSLNIAGYDVEVFERSDRAGGLLIYGIPDMKLDKNILKRTLDNLEKSGIKFNTNQNINSKAKAQKLAEEFDAIVLSTGASEPKDLKIEGRDLKGIMFAVDFLTKNTKSLFEKGCAEEIAKDKDVLIIGSGDTSVDCAAVAVRQGAKNITRFERSAKRSLTRLKNNPWPLKADIFKTDYGLEEAIFKYGKDPRDYEKLTKKFIGKNGKVEGVIARDLKKVMIDGKLINEEIKGSDKFYKADLILLAMGFEGSENNLKEIFEIKFDEKNNIEENNFNAKNKIFVCGDARIGQSLVVWAIEDGKKCAEAVDEVLSLNNKVLKNII